MLVWCSLCLRTALYRGVGGPLWPKTCGTGAPQHSCRVSLAGEILQQTKLVRAGSCGHLVLSRLGAGLSAQSALPRSGCPGCSSPRHRLPWPAWLPLPGRAVCPAQLHLSSPGQSRSHLAPVCHRVPLSLVKTYSVKAGSWLWWGEDRWGGGNVSPALSLPVAPFGVPLPPVQAGLAPEGPAAACSWVYCSVCSVFCCWVCSPAVCRLWWGCWSGWVAGQGLGALARAAGSSEPGCRLLSSSCHRELLGELVPVLTLLCSLLDGSFHKHVICKVSVLYHCGPPSGLAPSEPPGWCRWESWGGSQGACRARQPQGVWGGRVEPCSQTWVSPALGMWMAPAWGCD